MSEPRYFDRDGQPMTLWEWAAKCEDLEYKRVAEYTFEDGTYVSTVWLGLNHRHGGSGPPLIFETMIFAPDHPGSVTPYSLGRSIAEQRYATEAEARAGHLAMIDAYRRGEFTGGA